MDYLMYALLLGAGATAVTDLWALTRKRLLGIALPDYALVGRWLAYLAHGRFHHDRIAATPPVPHEHLIGWTAHYLIGIAFAALLLTIWGLDWARDPTLGPALIVGIGTVAAPFLLMQPGMGAGIAASRTPRPAAARAQSVVTHAIFGLGLYATGWARRALRRRFKSDCSSPIDAPTAHGVTMTPCATKLGRRENHNLIASGEKQSSAVRTDRHYYRRRQSAARKCRSNPHFREEAAHRGLR